MTMRLLPDDDTGLRGVKVSVRPECFSGGIEQIDWARRKPYDEFDYGYVLTVHKAQGSQWDDVVLFDESFAFPGQPRALALYRRHAGGEEADGGGVNSPHPEAARSAASGRGILGPMIEIAGMRPRSRHEDEDYAASFVFGAKRP